ncbi:hypothetical protein ES708_22832 [subsurface metagenome]
MGGRVSHIQEERLTLSTIFVDHRHCSIADSIGVVVIITLRRDKLLILHQRMRVEIVRASSQCPIEMLKTTGRRKWISFRTRFPSVWLRRVDVAPDVPLTRHQGVVSSIAEHFGDGEAVFVKISLIGRVSEVGDHMSHAGLMGVQPGQE